MEADAAIAVIGNGEGNCADAELISDALGCGFSCLAVMIGVGLKLAVAREDLGSCDVPVVFSGDMDCGVSIAVGELFSREE